MLRKFLTSLDIFLSLPRRLPASKSHVASLGCAKRKKKLINFDLISVFPELLLNISINPNYHIIITKK